MGQMWLSDWLNLNALFYLFLSPCLASPAVLSRGGGTEVGGAGWDLPGAGGLQEVSLILPPLQETGLVDFNHSCMRFSSFVMFAYSDT